LVGSGFEKARSLAAGNIWPDLASMGIPVGDPAGSQI